MAGEGAKKQEMKRTKALGGVAKGNGGGSGEGQGGGAKGAGGGG